MSDVLFASDVAEFKLSELFTSPTLSRSLNKLAVAPCLSLTPAQIFNEIKEVANKRFNHQLPELKRIQCMNNVF